MIIESFATFVQKIMFFTSYINNNSSFPKPLTQEEENNYLQKMIDGDRDARDILIRHNLRLVAHVVKKYSQADETDDLISVGSLGLIKAINTYKLGLGTQFSTYAARCIENEILMLLRVNKKHKNTVSIEETLCSDGEDNDLSIIDLAFEPENDLNDEVSKVMLCEALTEILKKYLTPREYQILSMRYGLNDTPALTQREVAKHLGISRSYISRIEKKALETLRNHLNKDDYV